MDIAKFTAMRCQMQAVGPVVRLAKEITTCLPDYYRWTHMFFADVGKGSRLRKQRQGQLVLVSLRYRQ